jgi:hypothetical protein
VAAPMPVAPPPMMKRFPSMPRMRRLPDPT